MKMLLLSFWQADKMKIMICHFGRLPELHHLTHTPSTDKRENISWLSTIIFTFFIKIKAPSSPTHLVLLYYLIGLYSTTFLERYKQHHHPPIGSYYITLYGEITLSVREQLEIIKLIFDDQLKKIPRVLHTDSIKTRMDFTKLKK